MKYKNRHTWIFRCYDADLGDVQYKLRHLLTVREAKAFVNELLEDNPSFCISVFMAYKMD